MKELVRQGTIFGPVLCCVNSVKINEVGERVVMYITPEISIGALAYVDDIMAAGSKDTVEKIGNKLRTMEKEKKYTFNNANGKSHYMIIKTRREKEEEVNIKVEKGKIKWVKEYKYLRNWVSEKGTVERQLEEIERKTKGMVIEAKRIGNEDRTGIMSTEIQILIYEKTIVPAMTFNLEVWTNWRKKDWEKLEKIQTEALRKIFNLPNSTPKWALLKELGVGPLKKGSSTRSLWFTNRL